MFLKRIEILSNYLGDMIQDLVNLSRMGQLEHSSEEADIFNPFRSLNTEDAFGKTTGLGLTLVKKLLDNAGGSIQVDTAPDLSTRMTIKLPSV